MAKLCGGVIILALLLALIPAAPVQAEVVWPPLPPYPTEWPGCEFINPGPLGDILMICMPETWNHDVVIFAHGYMQPYQDVRIPWDQLVTPVGETNLVDLVRSLGYAFAVSSYTKNGLAVLEGVQAVTGLSNYLQTTYPLTAGQVMHTYLVGASEGGLVATLALERNPAAFSGALAVCGPIGDFRKQVNYWGDFRAVFDYFYPVLPPSAVNVPDALIQGWLIPDLTNHPEADVVNALMLDAAGGGSRTRQLLSVTKAPIDSADPINTAGETILGILYYNVLATQEARVELGGIQPYGNTSTLYLGSDNDWRLNRLIKRYAASANTAAKLAPYQTSGKLTRQLVTMHTTGDPIVPVWQQTLYRLKVLRAGSLAYYTGIPISDYGHCAFDAGQLLWGFSLMVLKASLTPVSGEALQRTLGADGYKSFEGFNRKYGDALAPVEEVK